MQASNKSAGQPGAPRGSVVELAHRASVETMTEAVARVLVEIANLMRSQREVLTDAIDSEAAGELIEAARLQASVCGWLADQACDALGTSQMKGDAAEWVLSPDARQALATIKGLGQ